ncbi:MAG: T9SS type A sorting domain-containing protein [Bacteroidales bacterium]|nr:T9SS type A sorting domain-containing protein [Bacteroidales bacterium]
MNIPLQATPPEDIYRLMNMGLLRYAFSFSGKDGFNQSLSKTHDLIHADIDVPSAQVRTSKIRQAIFLCAIMLLGLNSGYAQIQSYPSKLELPEKYRHIAVPSKNGIQKKLNPFVQAANPLVEFNWPQEITVGSSYYDRQSLCSSPQGRLSVFLDGTLSAAWNYSSDTVSFNDIGPGYSYFDGNAWSGPPTSRIGSGRTINPCAALFGAGEAIVAESYPDGPVKLFVRNDKGIGDWSESTLPLPAGVSSLKSPVLVSSGIGNTILHVLATSNPESAGGVPYQGMDGALLYYRSLDGGQNWDIAAAIPEGCDSSSYNGFNPGTYAFAEPKGSNLAFIVGDSWSDLFVMRSADNGNSWQKTVLWQHPYPFWNGEASDSVYCPDGAVHLAFDESGKLHVVFGLTRLYSDGSQVFRFPFVGGIGHWMDGDSLWTGMDQLNCLNPDSLEAHGHLACSYLLDWNGNGNLDFLWNFPDYGVGPISHPQIAFDQYGVGMLLMSSVTEAYNNDIQDYRHIWYRYLYFGAIGNIAFDWNNQPQHLFHEAVFPSIGSRSPDNLGWPFLYQMDDEPGMAVAGDMDPFAENSMQRVDLQYMLPVPLVDILLTADPPEGGNVFGPGEVFYGTMTSIEAVPFDGWEFVNWTSENVVFSTSAYITFQALWNYNLVAHFRLIQSLPALQSNEIKLFPNPANTLVNIRIPEAYAQEVDEITLMDMNGIPQLTQLVKTTALIQLSLDGIAPGVYIAELRFKDGSRVRKVIVKA